MSVRPKEERLLLDERTENGQARRLALFCAWGLCRAVLAVWGKTQEVLGAVEFRVTAEPVLRVLVEALRDELQAVQIG